MIDLKGEILICGDFNLHIDVPSQITSDFLDILSVFDLKQHVDFETHIHGHTLDLIISHKDSDSIKNIRCSDRLSDHFSLIGDFSFPVPTPVKPQPISFRKIGSINHSEFRSDLLAADFITNPANNVSGLSNQLFNSLHNIINKHAPMCTKIPKPQPPNPWITPEIISAKQYRRRLEKIWRKSKTAFNRSRFSKQVKLCNRLIAQAKHTYYTDMVSESSDNPRKLWSSINKILHRKKSTQLPDHDQLSTLTNSFSSFFVDKIAKIRLCFPPMNAHTLLKTTTCCNSTLHSFKTVTEEEVHKLISNSPNKSCDLDPIPTTLLKTHLDILIKPITALINMSLQSGEFPTNFKSAHVHPLLKKSNLPHNELKNYRPVSNLNFISKIIEKVVASQINDYLKLNNLHTPFQSAYRKGHSTETALLKLQNDILTNMDNGNVTALCLLDLSAAFDTIDHEILMETLSNDMGINGVALAWLKSYLSDRTQQVNISGTLSEPTVLRFGVPQGSVLGPLLFSLYTKPLSDIIKQYDVRHHFYADDTQIYTSLSTIDCQDKLKILQECLKCVQDWMFQSKLKLNPSKTEFIVIGNKNKRNQYISNFPCNILGTRINPSPSVRNLGVIFDEDFNYQSHILQTCKSCFYHIRDLKRIRKHLSLSTTVSLANALVISKLDYCNSLFAGIRTKELNKLQKVQNCLARIVKKAPRFSPSTPLLSSLHWLPIESRILFKIGLITYKTLSTGMPYYIHDLLSVRNSGKNLRTDNGKTLAVPRVNHTLTGLRAFSVKAPVFWNDLPLDIRNSGSLGVFKTKLKTFLYRRAFPP